MPPPAPPHHVPHSRDLQPGMLRAPALESLGVPHAWSTRCGGVSGGIFASLNFGNPSDLAAHERDPRYNIDANIERLLLALGMATRRLVQVHQVHGGVVHVASRASGWADRPPPALDPKADAIVSDDPRLVLGVRVADCVPILLASEDGRVVGAVHAGWRGVVGDVLPHAIEAMRGLGALDVVAAIGPCIGRACMEVGPEVVEAFRTRFGVDGAIVQRHPDAGAAAMGKAMLDLPAALARQCREAGVATCDTTCARCTVQSMNEDATPMFFSHRRDGGKTGRMIAVIGARR